MADPTSNLDTIMEDHMSGLEPEKKKKPKRKHRKSSEPKGVPKVRVQYYNFNYHNHAWQELGAVFNKR